MDVDESAVGHGSDSGARDGAERTSAEPTGPIPPYPPIGGIPPIDLGAGGREARRDVYLERSFAELLAPIYRLGQIQASLDQAIVEAAEIFAERLWAFLTQTLRDKWPPDPVEGGLPRT